MDIRKLQRAIVDGLEDVKAQGIQVFDTEHLSPLFERVVIASGTSNRQTKALAASVRDAVRAKGFTVMRTEGEANGEWIIVDCGAAVVHVMQPTIRDYYHLEEIWGGKPVKLKSDTPASRSAKTASAEEPTVAKRAAAGKKAPAKKAPTAKAQPTGRAPAVKAPAKKAVPAKSRVASAPVAKKAPAKRAAPAKAAITRTVGVKGGAALAKAAAKKVPAKKAPAKKAVAKKTSSRA